jgi:hypothetical protein
MLAELAGALVLAASSSDGDAVWLLLLSGPVVGAAVYGGIWQHYRNTDKSHSFEQETRIVAQPASGQDRKVGEKNGTTESTVRNKNSDSHRMRVSRRQ